MPAIQKDISPLAVRVGETIRTLRKARGMKQYTLAYEVGYESRSTIAAIEKGLILPSLDKARDIATALGVTTGDLLHEAAEEGSEASSTVDAPDIALETALLRKLSWQASHMPLPLLQSLLLIAESLNAAFDINRSSNSQYYFRVFHAS